MIIFSQGSCSKVFNIVSLRDNVKVQYMSLENEKGKMKKLSVSGRRENRWK